MHEIISPRGHVAFIEIEPELYIVLGANIPRNGYKKLINRLNNNAKEIETLESIIKNPNIKNQILIENEQYLKSFFEQQQTIVRKKKI